VYVLCLCVCFVSRLCVVSCLCDCFMFVCCCFLCSYDVIRIGFFMSASFVFIEFDVCVYQCLKPMSLLTVVIFAFVFACVVHESVSLKTYVSM
jgi:hypothetical protein